jgi:hypothetical protein
MRQDAEVGHSGGDTSPDIVVPEIKRRCQSRIKLPFLKCPTVESSTPSTEDPLAPMRLRDEGERQRS